MCYNLKYPQHIQYLEYFDKEEGYLPFLQIGTSCTDWGVIPVIVSDDDTYMLEMHYMFDAQSLTWPHTVMIDRFGNCLKEIRIGFCLAYESGDGTEPEYGRGIYRSLSQMLQKCTSLEYLALQFIKLSNEGIAKNAVNTCITTLEISRGEIYYGGLEGLIKSFLL